MAIFKGSLFALVGFGDVQYSIVSKNIISREGLIFNKKGGEDGTTITHIILDGKSSTRPTSLVSLCASLKIPNFESGAPLPHVLDIKYITECCACSVATKRELLIEKHLIRFTAASAAAAAIVYDGNKKARTEDLESLYTHTVAHRSCSSSSSSAYIPPYSFNVQEARKERQRQQDKPAHFTKVLYEYLDHTSLFSTSIFLDTDEMLVIYDAYPKSTFHLLILPKSGFLEGVGGVGGLLPHHVSEVRKMADLAAQIVDALSPALSLGYKAAATQSSSSSSSSSSAAASSSSCDSVSSSPSSETRFLVGFHSEPSLQVWLAGDSI